MAKKSRAKAIAAADNVETIRLTHIGDERCVPAVMVLKAARKADLHECLIVARDTSGQFWIKSSLNAGQTLFLLTKARQHVETNDSPWALI